jgi:uncharacterized coiled-coil protein SlyX
MTKARAKKAKRILAVEKQLRRIEDLKMYQLQRRLVQLEAEQVDIIEALNKDGALQGLFIDTMAKRLGALAEEANRVACERDEQARRVIARATEEKCAERLSERLDDQVRRLEQRKGLAELIERFTLRKP